MRKSKILALFLTVVFVLANVTTVSFADYIYEGFNSDSATVSHEPVLPIEGKPYHISFATGNPEDTYAIAALSGSYPVDDINFDAANGVLNLEHDDHTGVTSNSNINRKYLLQIKINGTRSFSINNAFASFNYTFDDGVLPSDNGQWKQSSNPLMNNLSLVENGDDDYATSTTGSSIRTRGVFFKAHTAYTFAPYVLEMEVKDFRNDILPFLDVVDDGANDGRTVTRINETWVDGLSGATKGENFDFANFDIHDGEWHKLKWVITQDAYTIGSVTTPQHFDLYIDDMLVVENAPYSDLSSDTINLNEKPFSIDNFRRYGTTLGFAYDASLASDGNTVGSTLTATAGHAEMPNGNIPEALEYAFYTVDTVDGAFDENNIIQQGATATYTLTEEDAGKIIKVAAHVKETSYDNCASEWVIADEYVEVTEASSTPAVAITVDGVEKDITAENIIADTGSAAIAITINEVPAGADKFVLAQYAKVDSKPVLKSVVSTANTTINLSASDLSADSEFKLFMLTESGLIPKNVISFK